MKFLSRSSDKDKKKMLKLQEKYRKTGKCKHKYVYIVDTLGFNNLVCAKCTRVLDYDYP